MKRHIQASVFACSSVESPSLFLKRQHWKWGSTITFWGYHAFFAYAIMHSSQQFSVESNILRYTDFQQLSGKLATSWTGWMRMGRGK